MTNNTTIKFTSEAQELCYIIMSQYKKRKAKLNDIIGIRLYTEETDPSYYVLVQRDTEELWVTTDEYYITTNELLNILKNFERPIEYIMKEKEVEKMKELQTKCYERLNCYQALLTAREDVFPDYYKECPFGELEPTTPVVYCQHYVKPEWLYEENYYEPDYCTKYDLCTPKCDGDCTKCPKK